MKFFCDGCNAKYSIADEKVRGKVVRVRCKRCGEIITVTEQMKKTAGVASASGEHIAAPGGPPQPPGQSASSDEGVEWYYSIEGETYGPFDEGTLVKKCQRGEVGREAYVWNRSFSGWKPAKSVEPFQTAMPDDPPARSGGPQRKSTMGVTGQIEAIDDAPEEGNGGGPQSPADPSADRGISNDRSSARDRSQSPSSNGRDRGGARSRDRKRRRRENEEGGGKNDRKERLDRLRNKLKSNFGPGGSDDREDDAETAREADPDRETDREPDRAEADGPDDSDLSPAPEDSERSEESSGSGSFSEPFDEEITDEETVESDDEPTPSPEESSSESFGGETDEAATVDADLDELVGESAGGEAVEDETFDVSRDELPVEEARPDEQPASEAEAEPDDSGGGFELPPPGSNRRSSQETPDPDPPAADQPDPSQQKDEESADSHSGLFDDVDDGDDTEDEKAALPTAPSLGDDEEDAASESFADSVSQSLMVQLDKIQDEGKGRRYAVIGGAVAFVLAGAGVWYYVWSSAPNKDDDIMVQDDGPDIVTENTGSGGEKTYSEEEREKILTISPQKVEKKKVEKKEKQENDDKAPTEVADKEAGAAAETGQSESGAQDKQRVAQKETTKSEESDDELRLRGPTASSDDDGPSMDDALEGAEKRSDDEEGVDREMEKSEGSTTSADVDKSSATGSRDFEAMEALEGSSATIERADDSSGDSGSDGSVEGGLPGKLSKDQIRAGVKKVRSSVAGCRRRQARRGVPIDAKKVYMTLTVEPTGNVSDFDLSPKKLYGTVFEKCLHSRKSRWSFGSFEGSAQKMKAPFILSK